MTANLRRCLLVVPLALLLGIGCQTAPTGGGGLARGTIDSDPLKGGGPPLPPAGSALARGERLGGTLANQGGRPSGPLPALPTPSSSTSPAALTAGATSTLDQTAAPLRIPGDTTWRGPGESPRVTIQPPAPAAGFDTTPAVPLPATTQVAHLNGATDEQLLRILQARGVQPEVRFVANEWLCTCRVPNGNHPNLLHVYEAAADTKAAALQAVIEQIDRDRR
jgi:hypothetical protein